LTFNVRWAWFWIGSSALSNGEEPILCKINRLQLIRPREPATLGEKREVASIYSPIRRPELGRSPSGPQRNSTVAGSGPAFSRTTFTRIVVGIRQDPLHDQPQNMLAHSDIQHLGSYSQVCGRARLIIYLRTGPAQVTI
jgi:hypothetical protein